MPPCDVEPAEVWASVNQLFTSTPSVRDALLALAVGVLRALQTCSSQNSQDMLQKLVQANPSQHVSEDLAATFACFWPCSRSGLNSPELNKLPWSMQHMYQPLQQFRLPSHQGSLESVGIRPKRRSSGAIFAPHEDPASGREDFDSTGDDPMVVGSSPEPLSEGDKDL